MVVNSIHHQTPFTTRDGSTIRSILDASNAPVRNQSLAEAALLAGCSTERHWHERSEELYFILSGRAEMEVDGQRRGVAEGDAILIPAGSRHRITARENLRFLCCCAPPYAHEDTFFE